MLNSTVLAFDSMASEYDSWFDGKGKLIFPIETRPLQQILPALPRPWLEIGVGSGRFAQALGIPHGLDPSSELIKMARNRGVNAFLASGETVPFKDDAFGAVFLIVTLCFTDSPAKVLAESHRILCNAGRLVLAMVLAESPWGKEYKFKKYEGHPFYDHAAFYTYAELETLTGQAGFAVQQVVSTLFQKPGQVEHMESPQHGFSPDAGFTVIVAARN